MKEKDYEEYCKILNNIEIPSYLDEQAKLERMQPLNDWIIKHTPQKLYKFRACNENNITAFRNQQIWFATGSAMNDDYDAILYCDKKRILANLNAQFDKDGILSLLTMIKNGDKIPQILHDQFGESYITQISELLKSADKQLIMSISKYFKSILEAGITEQFPFISYATQNSVKISSFSENIYSPLMWGHYANNSTGFALAYDFRNNYYNECPYCDKLGIACLNPKLNSIFPIIYDDKLFDATEYAKYLMQDMLTRKLIFELKVSEQLGNNILKALVCPDLFMQTKIITRKYNDWRPENEWRMTISYPSPSYANDKSAYIWKKPSALYLGRKIKDTDELVLRNIAYKQHIPVYKMIIDDTSSDYRLKPIRQKNTPKQLLLK